MIRKRRTGLIAVVLLTTTFLTATASPAWADSSKDASHCWVNAETGVTKCLADDGALLASIVKDTGGWPAEVAASVGLTSARPAALAATYYTLARLYESSSYGGDQLPVVGPSTTYCDSNSVNIPVIASGWNDVPSSVKVYYGCNIRLYEDTSYGGTSQAFGNATSLGVMNNETSSYKVY